MVLQIYFRLRLLLHGFLLHTQGIYYIKVYRNIEFLIIHVVICHMPVPISGFIPNNGFHIVDLTSDSQNRLQNKTIQLE